MPPAKHGCECVCVCMWGGGGFRLRCKMDSYIFMNSVRKVKRKQYDNLAVIAFFPLPTVFWQSCEPLPETYDGDQVRQRSVTAVTVRYTLTPYPRPVNPARGQVVVLPNPSALWVMGWLSLVLRWPVICLINQYRQQIIELLTGLSELHLSSDPARARRTKSNQMCLGLWCPDIISFYSPDSFIWHPDLWLKAIFILLKYSDCALLLSQASGNTTKSLQKNRETSKRPYFKLSSFFSPHTCQSAGYMSAAVWKVLTSLPSCPAARSLCVNLDLAQGYSHPPNVM